MTEVNTYQSSELDDEFEEEQSPLGEALHLAASKYKDNVVVQSIVSGYKTSLSLFKTKHINYTNDYAKQVIQGLTKGIEGERGYNLAINPSVIKQNIHDPAQMLIDLACVQTRADCLILALQALGEEIEY